MIQTNCPEGLEELKVAALMEENSRSWNLELMSLLFDPVDIDRIKTLLSPLMESQIDGYGILQGMANILLNLVIMWH